MSSQHREINICIDIELARKRFIITSCKSFWQTAARRKMFLSILLRTKINQRNAQFALMDPRTQQQPTTENRSSEAGTTPTVSIACFHYGSIDRSIACWLLNLILRQLRKLFCSVWWRDSNQIWLWFLLFINFPNGLRDSRKKPIFELDSRLKNWKKNQLHNVQRNNYEKE